MQVGIISAEVGALSNALRPIFKAPADGKGGGITILEAEATMSAAGTSALNLVDLGTTGTAVGGTIATLGSSVYVANTPKAFVVSSAFLDGGNYLGVEEANVGAAATVTIVSVKYVMGKAG
jgi:hypothetical protein